MITELKLSTKDLNEGIQKRFLIDCTMTFPIEIEKCSEGMYCYQNNIGDKEKADLLYIPKEVYSDFVELLDKVEEERK